MHRVAVWGAGVMGQTHAHAIAHTPGLMLSAWVDPSADARRLANDWGVAHYTSPQAMLAQHRPDAVVIATPNAMHVAHAQLCLDAQLPCLLEKPVATTLVQAQALLDAVGQASVPVLVGHHRAHSAIMREARAVVQSGALGRLVCVMGSAVFHKPPAYFDAAPWRGQPGGGPVLLNLIHDVHNLRMLCGEVVGVQALASQAVRGLPVEDTVAIGLQFASGVVGTFMLSDTAAGTHSWEQTAGENPAYAHDPNADCYVLWGTHGSLSIPTLRWRSVAPTQTPSWMSEATCHTRPVTREDPIHNQMAHFAAVLRNEAVPLVTVADGVANVCVTEAVLHAAATGTTVRLDAPLSFVSS